MIFERVRILPALMVCAALLFAVKLVNLAVGVEHLIAGNAVAQAAGENEDAMEAADEAENETAGEADKTGVPPKDMAAAVPPMETATLTPGEIQVLKSLSARRGELDDRERNLDLRARLLEASQKRVEERIAELKEIQAQIEGYFVAEDEAEADQLANLVKMYENMKPKDAARIFERLDMGVLLRVVERMNARKMSAVLAKMDPVSAQELTVELATRRTLPTTPAMDADGLPDALPDPG